MVTKYEVLDSIKFVSENSQHVSIDQKALDDFVASFKPLKSPSWRNDYPLGYTPQENINDEIDLIFLLASQGFCYWGFPTKWKVNYKDQELDGWWAEVACFQRALEEEVPILEGSYLAKMTLEETSHFFRGSQEIPMLAERHSIFNEIGKTLVEKYEGRFHNFYGGSEKEAFGLLSSIAETFSGFDDIAEYKGRKVYFFKRANLAVSDLEYINKGQIKNVEFLPGYADYKIPAMLRKLGILVYNQQLSNKVDNRVEIPKDTEEEIEIRANQLYSVGLISEQLQKKYPSVTPLAVQDYLWLLSQDKIKLDQPYHLTRTIYY